LRCSIKDYVDTPDNRYYYSFKHGPVYLVVLDVGEDKEDSHWAYSGLNSFEGYRDEQTEWLKKEIEKKAFKDAAFRVVITHIPLFGGNERPVQLDCRKKWAPLFNKGKIDLHISGHTHRAAVVEPVAGVHDYPVFIGGGPKDGQYTVIRVDAANKALNVSMIDADGEVIGTYKTEQKKKSLLDAVLGS
jgi:acid phosphatase type 7